MSTYVYLSEYPGPIGVWVRNHFPATTVEQRALVLAEETGEAVRCVSKMVTGSRGTPQEWRARLYEEIGDVFIALTALAVWTDIDLDEAVADRWATIQARDPHAVR